MQAQTINTIREQLVEQEADVNSLLDGLCRTLLGHGFIVTCEGLPLHFDVNNNVADTPRPTSLRFATRFTQQDAEALAKLCTNGNGTPAKAIHLNDACRERLAEIARTREYLTEQLNASYAAAIDTAAILCKCFQE